MRKFSFCTCAALAAVLFMGASTTNAYGANTYTYSFPGGGAVIIGGGSYNGNACGANSLEDLKNILGQLQGSIGNGCFNFPETALPGCQTKPENPIFPDKNIPVFPDQNIPDSPDQNIPDQPGNVSQDEYAAQVVKLVNEERAKMGLKALTVNTKAENAALVRAKELERSFSHTRPNGSDFSTALTAAGINYQSAGENIAYGQKTPAAVMREWMNSSGHRANILGSQYTSIAVAHYRNAAGVDYWEQLFIR